MESLPGNVRATRPRSASPQQRIPEAEGERREYVPPSMRGEEMRPKTPVVGRPKTPVGDRAAYGRPKTPVGTRASYSPPSETYRASLSRPQTPVGFGTKRTGAKADVES